MRAADVRSVGGYLEKSLRKDPANKWELEQWLIYAQQFAALKAEERKLNLKLRAAKLEDDYQQLKARLHQLQSGADSLQLNSTAAGRRISDAVSGLFGMLLIFYWQDRLGELIN